MSESEKSRVNEARRLVKEREGRVNKVEHVSLYIKTLSLLLSIVSPVCVCTPIFVSAPVCMCDRGEGRKNSIASEDRQCEALSRLAARIVFFDRKRNERSGVVPPLARVPSAPRPGLARPSLDANITSERS